MFFYLYKVLFSGFLQFNGNFADGPLKRLWFLLCNFLDGVSLLNHFVVVNVARPADFGIKVE